MPAEYDPFEKSRHAGQLQDLCAGRGEKGEGAGDGYASVDPYHPGPGGSAGCGRRRSKMRRFPGCALHCAGGAVWDQRKCRKSIYGRVPSPGWGHRVLRGA